MREGRFAIADDVVIVTPSDGSNDELAVAKALRDELADWFGLILTIRSDSALPTGKRAIVIGISERPLIRNAFGQAGTQTLENSSLPEAYTLHAEGIYGATEYTRRCIAEVLAEKIDRGDLLEEHALRIGRQVLRDNALQLFPQLKDRLWKHKGIRMKPTETAAAAK